MLVSREGRCLLFGGYLPTSNISARLKSSHFDKLLFFAAQKPVAFAAPCFGTPKSPFCERHKKNAFIEKPIHWCH